MEEGREIKKFKILPNHIFNVPLTPLETLYSAIHSEINLKISCDSEGIKIVGCYVHLTEVKQLQQKNTVNKLLKVMQSIDESESQQLETSIKNTNLFQFLDAKVREKYLQSIVDLNS